MHTTYYFLRQLAAALTERLRGARVLSCFSQEKDELVVELVLAGGGEFWLKAQLGAAFPALALPESFHRARQNSVDLLPELLGGVVTGVAAWPYDRVVQLDFAGGATLAFKLYGPRPNAIFRPAPGAPAQLFHQRYAADAELAPAPPAPQTVRAAQAAALGGRKGELPPAEVAGLEQPAHYYLVRHDGRTRLSLVPLGEVLETLPGTDPLGALRRFVPLALARRALEAERRQVQQLLQRRADEATAAAAYARQRLHALAHEAGYRHRADLLMAHLHEIPAGASEFEARDFLTGQLVQLKLKPLEKPQQTAAALYRKAKNQQREETELRARIERRETEALHALERLEELATLPALAELRHLRTWRKQHGLDPATLEKPAQELPFRVFEDRGFTILVGRSAQNNDLLTQRYAHKDDLWLHAKDVSGSHVVVRHRAGQPIPEPVVEHAAQLAAWYSRRQHDSLCPVTVTPKKFVRKPKGALPGQVVVERERVVLVVPGNPFGGD